MHPLPQLLHSFVEIGHPEGKRFQRVIGEFPTLRHLVLEQTLHYLLKFLTNQHQTIDTFF